MFCSTSQWFKSISLAFIFACQSAAADESAADWWEGVEELLCSLNGAESCYVLTALCNMALSRPPEDWCFHKLVTALLLQVNICWMLKIFTNSSVFIKSISPNFVYFQIGFINNSTKDACHKTVRTQLSNITNVYPALISLVMHKLKHFIPQAGNVSDINLDWTVRLAEH